jgi:hypothetical protein
MTTVVEVYQGRWEHPSLPRRPLTGMEVARAGAVGFVCPLCAGQIKHTRREHADMVAAIRHPLLPELWTGDDDDPQIVSRGHHDPRRFLAAARAHAETRDWLDEAEPDGTEELIVTWHWWRYRPRARCEDGERVGRWVETTPGPGACPFTVVRESGGR